MTDHEVERLHEATLRILEEIGLRIEHDAVLARLLSAGARPGRSAQEVRFPRSMVGEYLALAPRAVTLAARDGTSTVLTSRSAPVFWTSPAMYIVEGQTRREIGSADMAGIARLCERLPSVQGIMGCAMHDVHPPHRDFVGLRVMAESTRKHLRAVCYSARGAEAMARMKPLFPGPWFSMGFTAHGPLRWTNLALDIFLRTAGHGIPTTINGEPMAGVTGPVTIAGAAAVGNAEILAGIVINQVLEPGRPVVHNLGLAHVFDMRYATAVTGGPENALFARAAADLGRFYGLPSASWVSTESVYEDEQAALEKMFGIQTHMESGVSLIWGLGQLESEKTLSLAQLVLDDEMVRYARRYADGFAVTDDDLQLDLIREVGIAGSFLDTEHTAANFRRALFQPEVLNRVARDAGPIPVHERARARAEELTSSPAEPPIPEDTRRELHRIEKSFAVA